MAFFSLYDFAFVTADMATLGVQRSGTVGREDGASGPGKESSQGDPSAKGDPTKELGGAITKLSKVKSQDKDETKTTRKDSIGASLARALIGSMAFLFKRPVRLFRPTKLSSWAVLEAMAHREGRSLSLRYMRMLLRREKSSFLPHLLLPPLLLNTLIGFTLFESYSYTEASLLRRYGYDPASESSTPLRDDAEAAAKSGLRAETAFSPLWIVTIAGGVAGAAQCFISAPLDNVRLILQTPIRTKSQRRRGSAKIKPRSVTLSWRAILRLAVLPFAPAITRENIVNQISKGAQTRASRSSSSSPRLSRHGWVDQIMSSDSKRQWEKTLRRWRGGVHGAGLVMSLARDSLGFASFFLVFEVSRRAAYHSSLWVDRMQAMLSSSPSLPVGRQHTSTESPWQSSRSSDEFHTSESVPDLSFQSSRTVMGRVVAAFTLIVGGAVGATLYELAGRPFELARVVIWEGRKAWEEGRRRPGMRTTDHEHAGTIRPTSGRKSRTGARAHTQDSRKSRVIRSRGDSVGDLRSTRIRSIVHAGRPRHPLRPRHDDTKGVHTKSNVSRAVHPGTRHSARQSVPSLKTRPTAYELLLEHAERTAEAEDVHRRNRGITKPPSHRPVLLLLLRTYFLKPFAVAHVPGEGMERIAAEQVDKTTPPSTRGSPSADQTVLDPTRAALRNWTERNSVSSSFLSSIGSSPGSHATSGRKSRPRFGASARALGSRKGRVISLSWANGRAAWALKRLATPYGIGFCLFAWLQDG